MELCRKTILLLIFSSLMSVGLGQDCDDGIEVELWGVYYDIESTTDLNLNDYGLTGDIPAEIGCLINLTRLYLFDNQLTGQIPVEIGNLINLTQLDLTNNQLTGEIPSEIGNLTNLSNLWLQYNQLTGEIPSEIGQLTNLTSWWLNHNQLTGEIPSEIGSLTNLTYLNLSYNQLTGEIPSEICNQGDSSPSLYNNQLCPPYPDCLTEEDIGYQDTSNCEDDCGAELGDVNGDSEINIFDLVQIANLILETSTPSYECAADYNQDGQVNILDLVQIANYILDN